MIQSRKKGCFSMFFIILFLFFGFSFCYLIFFNYLILFFLGICILWSKGQRSISPDPPRPDVFVEARVDPHVGRAHHLLRKLTQLLDGARGSPLEPTAQQRAPVYTRCNTPTFPHNRYWYQTWPWTILLNLPTICKFKDVLRLRITYLGHPVM